MTQRLNDAYATATAADTVRIERLLPGPIERVWSWLVDGEKRRKWLAGGEIEPKPGGKVSLLFKHNEFADEPTPEKYREMDVAGFPMAARVTRYEPPKAVGVTWPEGEHVSEVTFELAAEGDRVRLVLTHTRLRDRAQMADVSSGWHAHLAVLEDALEGRWSKGFWSNVRRLESEYAARFGAT